MRAALADDDVWITTGRDSIELVRRVIGPVAAQRLEQREGPALRDEVAFRVPRTSLPVISEAQHEERHRCGGFMLQDSEAEAMASLGAADTLQRDQFFVAPSYSIDNAATVQKLLPEADEPNVLATIRKLSSFRNRFHTSMTGEQAALYIRDTWKALAAGRDDITVELIDHEKTPQPSVKLTIRGQSLPDEIVVLGGHLDSISGRGGDNVVAPGADDNASGIACLTEIARAAVALDYRPARTVVFYGYAAEEVGLVGSAEIAARAKADGLDVVGVMQLDMTNYTTASPPYIGITSDFTDTQLNEFSVKLIEAYLDVPYKYFECGYACSDHASWTKNGFPSMCPHEADMDQGNDKLHTPGDTLALSKDSAAHSMHFVKFGLAFMAELAKGKLGAGSGAAACDPNHACAAGQGCNSGVCVPSGDAGSTMPGACSTSADCGTGQACANGRCGPAAATVPACSDADPCPMDLTCVASVCVVASGSTGKRDASVSQRDPSVRADAGARAPKSSDDDEADPVDDGELPSSPGKGGCGVAAGPAGSSNAWLLLVLAAWLTARRRSGLVFARRRRAGARP